MVFGLGCQRERLYKPLYVAHLFILAGVVYYYFQGSVGKPAPDHEIAGEPSQLVGETLRPVWGPTDKCYPVTTQRRRAKGGKKQASEENTKVRKEIAVYASGKTADPAPLPRDPAELSGRPLSGLWPWVGEGRKEAQVARSPILPECLGCLLLPSWSAGA
ncbi:uncharacterized protein LOC123780677 isoform X6 [Ursus americanus]|uniref:uncharacterized protein LOC123780677 isoform X6 n=1 Tax=Ursus americanus TaxID=9643 RepID=UPI001E67A5A0|nr:uncharacterized protein LOC123780677 isoform X6 [Ursus americanus]